MSYPFPDDPQWEAPESPPEPRFYVFTAEDGAEDCCDEAHFDQTLADYMKAGVAFSFTEFA